MVDFKERMSALEKKIDVIIANQVTGVVEQEKSDSSELTVTEILPLKSLEELGDFEAKMKNESFQKKVVSNFSVNHFGPILL